MSKTQITGRSSVGLSSLSARTKLCGNCGTYHLVGAKCRPISACDKEIKKVMAEGFCKSPEERLMFAVAYEAGLAEGRRLERRALYRGLLKDAGFKFTHDPRFHDWLKSWLAARSKRGKERK